MSKLVEAWKVKRELLRVWFHLADAATAPLEALAKRRYDRNFAKLTKVTDGDVAGFDKFAIFLTYQPSGFAKSIALTCQFLHEQGYAVLLVSSAKIEEKETAALAVHCWKMLERPNYGYDFGGYRDGLRILMENRVQPEQLIILNDSIWYPIIWDNRMVEQLLKQNLDMVGPVFETKPGRNKKHQHFQSYFTLLRAALIQSPAFTEYWTTHKVSNKKRVVLLEGEKRLSQAMFNAGFGGGMPSTRDILLGHLQTQSNAFLKMTLEYAAYDNNRLAVEGRALLAEFEETASWHERAILHMKEALLVLQPMVVFCFACIKLLDFTFMKKSSYPIVHDGMRFQYLRAVENGDLPAPHPDILAEIKASKMDPSLTTAPSNSALNSATKAE